MNCSWDENTYKEVNSSRTYRACVRGGLGGQHVGIAHLIWSACKVVRVMAKKWRRFSLANNESSYISPLKRSRRHMSAGRKHHPARVNFADSGGSGGVTGSVTVPSGSPINIAALICRTAAATHQLLRAGTVFFSLLTDAADIPASRAACRTPLPATSAILALSTLALVIGGRPNLMDKLRAAA